MTCVGISVVKNESDIIEIFVKHNLKFLDKLYIVDHLSQDNTLEILQKLKSQGHNLEISTNLSSRHIQEEAFNQIMKTLDADFITFIDADEFIIAPKDIKLPTDKVSLINWHNYLPQTSDDKNETNILKRIKYKLVPVDTNQHKALIPKEIYKNPNSRVPLGGHEIYYNDVPAPYELSSVYLAHFPARSLEQIQKKAFVNWLSKLANPLHHSGRLQNGKIPTEHHWKNLFDLFKNNSCTEERAMEGVREVYMRGKDKDLIYAPIDNDDVIEHKIDDISVLTLVVNAAEQQAAILQKANKFMLDLVKEVNEYKRNL